MVRYGDVVLGVKGFVVAENSIFGIRPRTISKFRANRRCEWKGMELPCMVHPRTPGSAMSSGALKPFNYVIAELPDEEVMRKALGYGVPVVVTGNRRFLCNLEVTRFKPQTVDRRARLI